MKNERHGAEGNALNSTTNTQELRDKNPKLNRLISELRRQGFLPK
jgi:hypothetical protein